MANLQNIRRLIDSDSLEEALAFLDSVEPPPEQAAEALFLRGKVLWRLGERAKATSAFAASARLDPEGPASVALEHARDVERFFNPDLLNP